MAKATICPECNGGPTYISCGTCDGNGKVINRRADGKILKPVDWMPPVMLPIILKQLAYDTDHAPHRE